MFCEKCGMKIEDDARFCPGCGTVVSGPQNAMRDPDSGQAQPQGAPMQQASVQPQGAPAPAPVNREPKESFSERAKAVFEKWKKLIIGGGVAAAALIVLLVIVGTHKPTIDMNDLVAVEFSGYDGYGYASATQMTRQEFLQKYGKKIKYNKKLTAAEKNMLGNSAADSFYDYVTDVAYYYLDKYNSLGNGDAITLSWNINEEAATRLFRCKLKYEPKEFTVDGLNEVGSFDAFADIKLDLGGYDGYGKVELDTSGSKYSLGYDVSQWENLSNGDTITVSLADDETSLAEYCASTYGEVPEAFSKTYTVSGLKEVERFDPFELVTVSFDGFSGEGTATVDYSGADGLRFTLEGGNDGSGSLSNGDTVTVRVDESNLEDYLDKNGRAPSTVSKVYKVEGLNQYVRTVSDLSDKAIDAIVEQASDVFLTMWAEEYPSEKHSPKSMTLEEIYVLNRKENSYYDEENYVNCMFRVEDSFYQEHKGSLFVDSGTYSADLEIYFNVGFRNVAVNAEGDIITSLLEYFSENDEFIITLTAQDTGGTGDLNRLGHLDQQSYISEHVDLYRSDYSVTNKVISRAVDGAPVATDTAEPAEEAQETEAPAEDTQEEATEEAAPEESEDAA